MRQVTSFRRSSLMWVFGSLLLVGLLLPTLSKASTGQCPGTTDHWYSPVSENLADKAPLPCETCEHPDNRQNPACVVVRMLASEDCADGRCTNEQGDFWLDADNGVAIQQSLRFRKPRKFPEDAGENCWFLLWALQPVVGVEQAGARDQRNYWELAYQAASQRIEPPIPDAELALVIQPANRRSEHQLHIHISRLNAAYRQRVDALPVKPGEVQAFEFDGLAMRAVYVPDRSHEAPLQSWSVFELVQSILPGGASQMPRTGILLVRSVDGRGFWVLAADGLMRTMLQLSAKPDCKLKLPQ